MLPLVTSDLPGTGGVCWPADRACEEVLAKRPAGTGPHWWVRVERRSLATAQARAAVARAAGVPVEKVGFAGSRDRNGTGVQWFSVPADDVEHPGPLRRAGTQGKMRVLELTASHKPVEEATVARLRWRFRLRRAAADGGYLRGRAVMDRLRRNGVPAYVPLERFGREGAFAKWGRMLAQGKPLPRQVRAAGAEEGRCLRAFQEQLFDRWLAARVADGLLPSCLMGDLIQGRDGSVSLVEDVAAAQRRLDSWEAVVLGPLFGEGMRPAAGEAAAREAAVLAEAGVDAGEVSRLRGGRRAARVQPTSVLLDVDGEDLSLACELPVDAFVSPLLDELVKTPADAAPARDEGADEGEGDDGDAGADAAEDADEAAP